MGGKQQEDSCDDLLRLSFPGGLKNYPKIFCEYAHFCFFFHFYLIDHSVQLQFPIIVPTSAPVVGAHPMFH